MKEGETGDFAMAAYILSHSTIGVESNLAHPQINMTLIPTSRHVCVVHLKASI
jgi:hypothetical protein